MNHHGRVRKIGDEDEDYEENEVEIMKNNWMGNTGQLDLISRREDVQVCYFALLSSSSTAALQVAALAQGHMSGM